MGAMMQALMGGQPVKKQRPHDRPHYPIFLRVRVVAKARQLDGVWRSVQRKGFFLVSAYRGHCIVVLRLVS
jgi:hypothetical protein